MILRSNCLSKKQLLLQNYSVSYENITRTILIEICCNNFFICCFVMNNLFNKVIFSETILPFFLINFISTVFSCKLEQGEIIEGTESLDRENRKRCLAYFFKTIFRNHWHFFNIYSVVKKSWGYIQNIPQNLFKICETSMNWL